MKVRLLRQDNFNQVYLYEVRNLSKVHYEIRASGNWYGERHKTLKDAERSFPLYVKKIIDKDASVVFDHIKANNPLD